ncbi:multiple epidermal growth factor-like domains protein 10 isoform X4 [Saccostrea cucullata]|uniref:multiple epidermal growth factor-like domains protein 10 isoform X4 n=1 Tax=Saccostrea cuccullata TaxID=36930 RepID=UPI002ECFC90F
MVIGVVLVFLLVSCTECYENLALNKPAWQQNPWPNRPVIWAAAKAVDGQYSDRRALGGQCTISDNKKQTAEWRVDLESVVSISHINIFYRTENYPSPGLYYGNFAGFFVYVSNTTRRQDGHLCFHELQQVNGTPTENQTINCPVHGRYVIYYNERNPNVAYPSFYSTFAYNDLCELEVYGCSNNGMYGEDCNQTCPDKCQEQRCNITTGHCLACIPGYQGARCSQACDQYSYGLGCALLCGNCSDGDPCHHVNGECISGCSEGVTGEKCQTECEDGTYGDDCRQICGHCFNESHCNHVNGTCGEGCSPGFHGATCMKECFAGYFGINCQENCKAYCGGNKTCNVITGVCDEGCIEGLTGYLCSEGVLLSRTVSNNCEPNTTSIIINIVISLFLVLTGSILNFIIWKRKHGEYMCLFFWN